MSILTQKSDQENYLIILYGQTDIIIENFNQKKGYLNISMAPQF